MKSNLVFLILLLFLAGCSGQGRKFYTQVDDVTGLSPGNSISFHGFPIGTFGEISVQKQGAFVVEIRITENEISIPSDSRIRLVENLLGEISGEILPGILPQELQPGDTLPAAKEPQLSEELQNLSGDFLQSILKFGDAFEKQDSILMELRKLNENLERFMEEQ